ncbi:MAG: hypothetical protein FJ014_14530 [Chloroflexi bacterium]|nr:hypothetical protein [Chloroflexota bacterium]
MILSEGVELMPTVRIAAEARRLILDECSKHDGLETGGILVGYPRPGDAAVQEVVAATGPGPEASHRTALFAPDVAYANAQLRLLNRADPRLRYVGTWHSHPGLPPRPSGGDLAQAQQILADTDYGLDSMVVIIAARTPPGLSAFILKRGDQGFDEAQMEVVPAPATPPGEAAVRAEMACLQQAGWLVEQRRTPDERTVLDVRRPAGETRLSFLLPGDYPRSAPQILARTRLPWPDGAKDINAATAVILGADALLRSQRIVTFLNALQRHGLSAQAVRHADGYAIFAVHGPGRRPAGFLTIQDACGIPAIYGLDLRPRQVEAPGSAEEWARLASRALGAGERAAPWVVLAVGGAIAAMTVLLLWLLRSDGGQVAATLLRLLRR